MVMDSNGEECSLRDYDLVCGSSVGWKLINLMTGPEMVRLVRMTYALPQFDEAQALRTFPSLKYARPGRITEMIDEVGGNDELRRELGMPQSWRQGIFDITTAGRTNPETSKSPEC